MRKIVYLLFFVFNCSVYSQSLSIFDIDTTFFPTIMAKLFAIDANANQILNLSNSNFELKENNQPRAITIINCTAKKPPITISSVLTIDASGSMNGIGLNMEKKIAAAWINALALGKNECAVTSFDNINYINQDFTTDRNKLLSAVTNIQANDGTDYDYGLLLPLGGSLVISSTGIHKKIVILLTDGCPNQEPLVNQIITEAKRQNCSIYSVVVGNDCPKCLKDISSQTGGQWFDNIYTDADAKKAYQQILLNAQGGEPCTIEWQSGYNCQAGTNNVELKLISLNLTDQKSYQSPYNSIMYLEFSPSFINFKNAEPGKKVDTILKITARNADYNITNIISSNPAFTISPKNFTLKKDETTNLIVSFMPNDSGYVFAKFSFENNNCTSSYSASGGFSGKKPNLKTLKLIRPVGGEEFIAGSDTLITWEGIAESDTVQLDYTIDSSKTWKTLTNRGIGLKYSWKNIPKPESNQCKVRVKQINNYGINGKPGIVQFNLTGHSDAVNKIKWSPDGSRLATASDDNSAIIWDANSGLKIKTLTGHTGNVYNIAWSPDGNRIATASWDSTAIIWDANSGTKIKTLTGHNDIVWDVSWSPDGNRIATSSSDNTAIIWNVKTGTMIYKLTGHKGWVSKLSWSPDDNLIATASNDNTAIIWNSKTGALLNTLKGHSGWVCDVSWSPDGNRIATSSFDFKSIIWDVNTGNKIHILLGHSGNVNKISWNPNGTKIATSSDDNSAIIWNVSDGTKLFKLNGLTYYVSNVSWSPDGNLLTACSDNSAIIWNVATGTVISTLFGHTGNVTDVSWNPDGSHIATSSLDNTSKIWFVDDSNSELQKDESNQLFSIIEPKAKAIDIDMGKCIAGSSKDSLIAGFISNIGTVKFRVDSIYISGSDASLFKVVSGIPKYELTPGSNKSVEIRFTPNKVGKFSAYINIITQSDTLKKNLVGEGTQVQIQVVSPVLDFGKVNLGYEKTITDTVLIKNISALPMTITDVIQLGPDKNQFEIVKGGGSFILQPNKTQKVTIKFKPIVAGRTSGRLGFEFNGLGSPALIQLFGEGLEIIPKITTNSPICDGDDLFLFADSIPNAEYNWYGPLGFKSNLKNPIIKKAKSNQSGKYYLYAKIGAIISDTASYDIVINSNVVNPGDSSLIFVGSASKEDDFIKLTDAKQWDGGSIWLKNRFSVKQDFSTSFKFRVRYCNDANYPDGSLPGADGFAFVMQNHIYPFLGDKGGSMGYTGITNSMAIEFDLYKNSWDPNGNHIAVQSMGALPNQPDHNIKNSCLGINSKIITVEQDSIYFAKVEYDWTKRKMMIYLDTNGNFDTPVMTIPNINLASYLKLEEGEYIYIGFTSSTGESYQEHDLFDWALPCKNQLVDVEEKYLIENNTEDFNIYPNPARDYIDILSINPTLKRGVDKGSDIQIFDMLGINVSPAGGGNKGGGRIDISNLSPGIYFIKIGNRVEKFVKM